MKSRLVPHLNPMNNNWSRPPRYAPLKKPKDIESFFDEIIELIGDYATVSMHNDMIIVDFAKKKDDDDNE